MAMTNKNDFEADDWKLIASAPIIAAAVISASDDVGYDHDSEDEEIEAFKNALDKFENKYAKSALVTDILAFIKSEGTEEFEVLFAALSAAASHESPLEDRAKAIGKILDELLPKKTAATYKAFVMEVAVIVARAHKEGLLPFASSISMVEDFHIRRLGQAIRV